LEEALGDYTAGIRIREELVKEAVAAAQDKNGKKPNILFIMGDDIGWMQPGCSNRQALPRYPNIRIIFSTD
jgi:hypothetical protein